MELSRSLGGLIPLSLLCMDMESPCLFIGRLVHRREKLPASVPRLSRHFLSSGAMHRAARCLTSLPVFSAIIFFFNFDHSSAYRTASHFGFNLHLSDEN